MVYVSVLHSFFAPYFLMPTQLRKRNRISAVLDSDNSTGDLVRSGLVNYLGVLSVTCVLATFRNVLLLDDSLWSGHYGFRPDCRNRGGHGSDLPAQKREVLGDRYIGKTFEASNDAAGIKESTGRIDVDRFLRVEESGYFFRTQHPVLFRDDLTG